MIFKLTGFRKGEHSVKTEIIAGITIFVTMCYILAVNPVILGLSGMPKEAVFTATAITAALATILMACAGKLPFALAPSMALNAFFTFTICKQLGHSWQSGLTITLIVGVLYTILILFNLHKHILAAIPISLQQGISVGVGTFIAFVGLQNAGILVDNHSTLVQLGDMNSKTIVAFLGIILSGVFMARNIKGGLFISIVICTLVGIPLGVTTLPENFHVLSLPASISETFCVFDFSNVFHFDVIILIFILLFVSIFDTVGTLVGLASKTGNVDEKGNVKNLKGALLSTSVSIIFGGAVGTSPVTTFAESTAGIAAGGKTGLTSLTVGIMFILSLFLSGLFLIIPLAATTGALVMVGVMMMSTAKNIVFDDYTEALPAYVTIIMIPLSYSIGDGVMMGILTYVFVKLLSGRVRHTNVAMYVLAALILLKFVLEAFDKSF